MIKNNLKNEPTKAGQMIGMTRVLHGHGNRYETYAIHTRGDSVEWVTADAYQVDEETGLLAIVKQASTYEEAMNV